VKPCGQLIDEHEGLTVVARHAVECQLRSKPAREGESIRRVLCGGEAMSRRWP